MSVPCVVFRITPLRQSFNSSLLVVYEKSKGTIYARKRHGYPLSITLEYCRTFYYTPSYDFVVQTAARLRPF